MLPIRQQQQRQVIDLTNDDPPSPVASTSAPVIQPQLRKEFTTECVERSKQWHLTVSSEMRNQLLLKLIKSILTDFDPRTEVEMDQRMQKVVCYMRKIEKEMYTVATSREHYYEMVAKKIIAIQKELEEKRQNRLQSQSNSTSSAVETSNQQQQQVTSTVEANLIVS